MGVKLTDLAALLGANNNDQIYIEDASEANDANKAKSITLSELAKLLSPTYRVVAFEEFRGTVPGSGGVNVNISGRTDPDHYNLGNIGIGSTDFTLLPGKKYLLLAPMQHSAADVDISIRSTPATGSQRDISFWNQTHARYYEATATRESLIFHVIDLTGTNIPEEVVLHISNNTSAAINLSDSGVRIRRHAILIIESA